MALTYVIFSEIIILTSITFTADGKCIPEDNGLFRFGPGCDFMCHCLDEKEQCNMTTGNCVSGCDWEWGGPGCQYKNIALGVQSRHLDNLPEQKSSRLANDKSLSTCSETDDQNASTKQNQPRRDNPWWKIMFPRNETFRELSFVTKQELLTNFSNFTVTVEYVPEDHKTHKSFYPSDNQVCYEQRDKVPKSTMITVICNRPLVGNQLRIQLGSLDTQLVLCDIRIFQGRNLVSKSSTNQSFSKAVDGYPYTCSYTTNDRLYWDADFVFVANIRLINITAYDKNCQNFSLSAFNGNEWILLHWEIYICKTAEIMQEVSARYIRLQRVDQGWFGLCEVQIFGDCHDDVCGFDCKQVCHCRNTNLEDKVSGVCSSGCKGRWTGTNGRCDKDCDETHWGPACQHECGRCKNNDPCNVENGYCLSGCIDGYQPPTCNDECEETHWGPACKNVCGHCAKGEPCNAETGHCSGCIAGYQPPYCIKECDNGTYGQNCTSKCSGNCLNEDVCGKSNGHCPQGCQPGFKDDRCDGECDNGTYGKNCTRRCSGNCLNEDVCDKSNGNCPRGCKPGFRDDICDHECLNGTYGLNCSNDCSRFCNGVCDKVNGTCSECKAGWTGSLCSEACTDGTYGFNCSQECSQFCSSVCNKSDGTCSECRAGWKGQYCLDECSDGTWGYECKLECGKCFGKGSCAKDAGICREGCQAGYRRTDKCEIECENGTYGIGCNETCGNCKDNAICDKTNGSCMIGCSQGFAGDICSIVVEQPQGIVVDVAISVGSVMVLLSISFAAVLLIIRSIRAVKSTNRGTIPSGYVEFGNKTYTNAVELISNVKVTERTGGQALVHLTAKENEHNSSFAYHNAGACLKEKSEHAVDISDFKAYVKSRFANEDSLIKEFQKLPEGLTCSVKDARIPENVVKNRYKDMVAYDHSRVVLRTLPNQPYSDYINASFIKGHCVERAYIASQGPNDANLKDVWRMIWEQDVRTIVMITNLVEEAKIKCIKYWPECEASVQFGSVHIETEREHVFAEFTVRYFKLSNEENPGVSRTVTQFHYTAWPDKNIPRSTSSLLHFWRKVRQNDEKKSHPWLVHCSAGVGRTGTFLAIDILYDSKDLGYLDVFQCVRDLREQRVNMVQTKEQYMYLHVVMVEAFVLPSTPVKIEQFPTVYKDLKEIDTRTGKTKLLMEYEVLRNEVRDQASEGNSGAWEISKNGIAKSSTKPTGHKINDYRPLLRTDVPGSSNNINALYISSYRDANAFVLTPTPMTNTVVDFCRLLHDQDIKVIVTFSNDWNEQAGICLPESGSLPIGPFTICFVSEEDRETHRLRTYTCRFKDNERTVTHLIFNKWPLKAIVPTDPYKMYKFLQYLETLKRNNYKTPVILQCLNGTERSGLVAVLMNVLEHARFDGEVSIPQVIRHLRFKSRQIIPNFEQYKFCYDVLLCFTESNATYANM